VDNLKTKICVIGLDGATFDLLNPWITTGELPTFKKIFDGGVHATSQSCLPVATYPNWKCYSTGKNPGKLGCYWFGHWDLKNKEFVINNSTSFKSMEYWDYLNDAGYSTGIINTPTTYPPKHVKGFMISGGPDVPSANATYTYPPKLQGEIEAKFNYRPSGLKLGRRRDKTIRLTEIQQVIASRFQVAKEYFSTVDVLQLTLTCTDTVMHYCWHNRALLRDMYQIIDAEVRDFMNSIHDDFVLLMMSDHGFGEEQGVFCVNEWLAQQGYLTKKKLTDRYMSLVGKLKARTYSASKKIGIDSTLRKIVPKRIREVASTPGQVYGSIIDWDKTRAYSTPGPSGLIFLNKDVVHQDQENEIQDQLIRELKDLEYPETGEKIINTIHKKGVYHGEYLLDAPDLVIEDSGAYLIYGEMNAEGKIWKESKHSGWVAKHRRNGMFLAYGPDIKEGHSLEDISIMDIAPTILHLMHSAIPQDMDGRVLTEIFQDHSSLANRPLQYRAPIGAAPPSAYEYHEGEDEAIAERLKALGYLG
jgi:predicted AlkP superfamily phosphohydrolase/phosphomutase